MRLLLLFFFLSLLFVLPVNATSRKTMLSGVHGDQRVMPKSCRACHRGMRMVIRNEEQTCLNCHGSPVKRQRMIAAGYLRDSGRLQLSNIESELRKPYNHPVLTVRGVHNKDEILPETIVNAARHSECVDCHEPHQVSAGRPLSGIPGKRVGNFTTDVTEEYQLCYKCHGNSANLPVDSSDKQLEFRPTNKSYHPIEAEGANAYVVSLKPPYVARKERPGDISIIKCTDCHGNDNTNGPKGPHGSIYRGLLVANYEMEDGRSESTYAYALCYRCHDRTSLLNDESFPYHSLHILGNRGKNLPGTSCFTCHDAHGSSSNPFLISFNPEVVEMNRDGKRQFKAQGVTTRHGSCALKCHGVEHEPKSY
ncbi:MAG: cytochrome C [Deltaproteobacteria bacterium]|nr:cytochrome C [Deltaproteobacteria bacterium]